MFKKHKWRLIFQLWTPGYIMPELICESFPRDDNATKDQGELEMLIYAGEQRVFQNGPGSYILYYGEEPQLRNMDIYERIDELQKKVAKEPKEEADAVKEKEPVEVGD